MRNQKMLKGPLTKNATNVRILTSEDIDGFSPLFHGLHEQSIRVYHKRKLHGRLKISALLVLETILRTRVAGNIVFAT